MAKELPSAEQVLLMAGTRDTALIKNQQFSKRFKREDLKENITRNNALKFGPFGLFFSCKSITLNSVTFKQRQSSDVIFLNSCVKYEPFHSIILLLHLKTSICYALMQSQLQAPPGDTGWEVGYNLERSVRLLRLHKQTNRYAHLNSNPWALWVTNIQKQE